MKVIDANTGLILKEGLTFENVIGTIKVLKIIPGIFNVKIELLINGKYWEGPLQVRWTHSSFKFQHVAFLNS